MLGRSGQVGDRLSCGARPPDRKRSDVSALVDNERVIGAAGELRPRVRHTPACQHGALRVDDLGPMARLADVESQISYVLCGWHCAFLGHGGTLSARLAVDSPPFGNHITWTWRTLRPVGSYHPERQRPISGGNTPRVFVGGRGEGPSGDGRPATHGAKPIVDQEPAKSLIQTEPPSPLNMAHSG